jgi:stage V sporulation protein K
MKETKKTANQLELIYNEYAGITPKKSSKKNPTGGFNIIGAKLDGADIGDFYAHCGLRHSFASVEGEYIYLKLRCEFGVKKFITLWNRKHNIGITGIGKTWFKPFISELITQKGEDQIAYIKIYAKDGLSSTYGQTMLISICIGGTNTYHGIYSITINEFAPEKLKLSFFKNAFTISPDHNESYLSFKHGETRTIGVSALCLDDWKENYDKNHSLLEYEMVVTDASGKVLYSGVSHLLKYTYDFEISEPEHLTVQNYISDVSHYEIGDYTCVIYFMGQPQLEMELVISEYEEIGWSTAKVGRKELKKMITMPSSEAMKKLENLIGLEHIKKDIKTHLNYVQLMRARENAGLKHSERILNMVFSGEPGTGKTTVCRLLGALLKDIGIISNGHLVEANRESLLGQYIGESEKRTKTLIEKAKGGILFIDEAYSLMSRDDGDRDFGRHVIDTLMTYLSEPDNDLIVVLAGYSNEMRKLLDSNPGLASRFPIWYEFPNYTPSELLQMAKLYFDTYDYNITEEVCERLLHLFEQAVNIPNFGNGRYVKTLIENTIIPNMANRIAEAEVCADDIVTLCQVKPTDVPEGNLIKTKTEKKRRIGFNIAR